jgi:hypothetical protein
MVRMASRRAGCRQGVCATRCGMGAGGSGPVRSPGMLATVPVAGPVTSLAEDRQSGCQSGCQSGRSSPSLRRAGSKKAGRATGCTSPQSTDASYTKSAALLIQSNKRLCLTCSISSSADAIKSAALLISGRCDSRRPNTEALAGPARGHALVHIDSRPGRPPHCTGLRKQNKSHLFESRA